jgi:hypothetical protein
MKKLILLLTLAVLTATGAIAQDYNASVGLRGGLQDSGISVKASLGGANMLEGILGLSRGTNIYLLYERNVPLDVTGLNFYYGAGGNFGNWKEGGKGKGTLGIDGVVGCEYKIAGAPIVLGVDYKPCLNIVGHTGLNVYDFGFNVRVVF